MLFSKRPFSSAGSRELPPLEAPMALLILILLLCWSRSLLSFIPEAARDRQGILISRATPTVCATWGEGRGLLHPCPELLLEGESVRPLKSVPLDFLFLRPPRPGRRGRRERHGVPATAGNDGLRLGFPVPQHRELGKKILPSLRIPLWWSFRRHSWWW